MKQVELKFRTINVSQGSSHGSNEILTEQIINKLNNCVVYLCSGQLELARQKFDEVISQSEENGGLGLREITTETESQHMLPAYLVTLLTYFYLRTKNLKMARALVKSRRFVCDMDHLV